MFEICIGNKVLINKYIMLYQNQAVGCMIIWKPWTPNMQKLGHYIISKQKEPKYLKPKYIFLFHQTSKKTCMKAVEMYYRHWTTLVCSINVLLGPKLLDILRVAIHIWPLYRCTVTHRPVKQLCTTFSLIFFRQKDFEFLSQN